MANVIVYGSGFTKHTKRIAEHLGKKMTADVYNAKDTAGLDLEKYDAVILGTNVHAGHPNKNVMKFFTDNKDTLSKKHVVLFISCMFDGEKGQKQAEEIAKSFGTEEFAFFPTKEGKNTDGIPPRVDEFVSKYFGSS